VSRGAARIPRISFAAEMWLLSEMWFLLGSTLEEFSPCGRCIMWVVLGWFDDVPHHRRCEALCGISFKAWAAKQDPPVTRPEAIRGMIDAMLHILSKDTDRNPVERAKEK